MAVCHHAPLVFIHPRRAEGDDDHRCFRQSLRHLLAARRHRLAYTRLVRIRERTVPQQAVVQSFVPDNPRLFRLRFYCLRDGQRVVERAIWVRGVRQVTTVHFLAHAVRETRTQEQDMVLVTYLPRRWRNMYNSLQVHIGQSGSPLSIIYNCPAKVHFFFELCKCICVIQKKSVPLQDNRRALLL